MTSAPYQISKRESDPTKDRANLRQTEHRSPHIDIGKQIDATTTKLSRNDQRDQGFRTIISDFREPLHDMATWLAWILRDRLSA